jgi:hypothetical protein
MLAASITLVCAALALAPTPERAAGEVASAGPVASDPLSRLQQNLAELEERTASVRAELLAHQAQQGGAAEHGPAAAHGMHGASRGLSGSHTIFKMPDAFDLRFTITTIFVLVVVTISFEKVRKAPPTTNPYVNPSPRPHPLPLRRRPRLFEQGSEHLEEWAHHASHGAHIKKELLEKMFKELSILGFVAFSATILLQVDT